MNTNEPQWLNSDHQERTPGVPTADPQEARLHFSRIGFSIMTLALVRILSAWAIELAVYYLSRDILTTWYFPWIESLVSLYGFGLPAMLLVLHHVPVSPRNQVCLVKGQEISMPRMTVGWWCVIAVIALGFMYIGSLIGNGLMAILSSVTGYDYENALQSTVNDSPLWATALFTVVAAPLGEELIFRKLLIDCTRRYGDRVSILLSAFFFAIFHGNLFQFFYAFALGLLLAYLYTRTGRMWWNVALHALLNFIGGVYTQALVSRLDLEVLASGDPNAMLNQFTAHPIAMSLYLLQGMLVYAFMLAAVILTICLARRVRLGRGTAVLPREQAASCVMGNAGMILATLVCVALLVLNLFPWG